MTRAHLTPDEDRDLEIAMEIGASACDHFLVAVVHKAEHDGVDPLDAIYSLLVRDDVASTRQWPRSRDGYRQRYFSGSPSLRTGAFILSTPDWSHEDQDFLRANWGTGMRASEIGRVCGGRTKSAVVGKAHRMHLPKLIASKGERTEDERKEHRRARSPARIPRAGTVTLAVLASVKAPVPKPVKPAKQVAEPKPPIAPKSEPMQIAQTEPERMMGMGPALSFSANS